METSCTKAALGSCSATRKENHEPRICINSFRPESKTNSPQPSRPLDSSPLLSCTSFPSGIELIALKADPFAILGAHLSSSLLRLDVSLSPSVRRSHEGLVLCHLGCPSTRWFHLRSGIWRLHNHFIAPANIISTPSPFGAPSSSSKPFDNLQTTPRPLQGLPPHQAT